MHYRIGGHRLAIRSAGMSPVRAGRPVAPAQRVRRKPVVFSGGFVRHPEGRFGGADRDGAGRGVARRERKIAGPAADDGRQSDPHLRRHGPTGPRSLLTCCRARPRCPPDLASLAYSDAAIRLPVARSPAGDARVLLPPLFLAKLIQGATRSAPGKKVLLSWGGGQRLCGRHPRRIDRARSWQLESDAALNEMPLRTYLARAWASTRSVNPRDRAAGLTVTRPAGPYDVDLSSRAPSSRPSRYSCSRQLTPNVDA